MPIFSIQYHPEASPGPADSRGYFARFLQMIDAHKGMAPQPPIMGGQE
ncbi:MAG: hypothetical protein M3Y13_05080 [Armatimonadota bacterium]|nr:hypothetical protein [Armatimonadota bacterium]